MSILRDKMKKRLKKDYTIDELIEDIKTKNYSKALSNLLEACDHKERIRYVSDIFKNSKYKSYKAAMNRFDEAVEKFFDGDRKYVETYRRTLNQEATEQPFSMNKSYFSESRKMILQDIINNASSMSYGALINMVSPDSSADPTDATDEALLSMISIIACRKWPDHNGLRILFG